MENLIEPLLLKEEVGENNFVQDRKITVDK